MPNRYFICTRNRPPIEFDICDDHPVDDADVAYFIRGFRILEQAYEFDGFTVCLAWGSTIRLPVLGPDVVALIYGDEHCRVPAYTGKVAAVLKCHGFIPNFTPRLRPLRLMQIEIVELLRNLALWLPTGWRYLLSSSVRARCHLVPLGYGTSGDLEIVPIGQRRYLMSFVGSVSSASGHGLRRLVGTPKSYSRRRMLAALRKLQRDNPARQIRIDLTGSFQESLNRARSSYLEVLGQTRLCPAPRGTAHETLRLYEALRLGCIVISDRLPSHPFYDDSPIVQIGTWDQLPAVLQDLERDPDRLEALQQRSLIYWRDILSETALARRYAQALGLAREPACQGRRTQCNDDMAQPAPFSRTAAAS